MTTEDDGSTSHHHLSVLLAALAALDAMRTTNMESINYALMKNAVHYQCASLSNMLHCDLLGLS
jgi:hypothetical protein